MRYLQQLSAALLGTVLGLSTATVHAADLPHLQRNGQATQLMVDGAPYLALGGELHNSSPSSPAFMAPIWDKLAKNHVRTVIGAASWELVEPEEGRFDFTAVDDQIQQARKRGIRLVMIWFGAYKNAESTYAPSWVRRNETRFPRTQRDPKRYLVGRWPSMGPVLSVFSEELVKADSRAFANLMRHIKQVDTGKTVIMMQVENEVGLLGDSRDHSPLAEAVWTQPVPAALMTYLREHRDTLKPWMRDLWARQGYREGGSWVEVFGNQNDTRDVEEVFMAWGFGRYVEHVTKAGAAEYALPMYANAWLGPQPNAPQPGQYPSGGPVARMLDVWKAAAPSLALLSPDIYIDDFAGVLTDFRRVDNPIFIPESRIDAGNLFIALGQHAAIGYHPFGLEDADDDSEVFRAYGVLNEMTALIASAQAEGRIRGFKLVNNARQKETLGGYEIAIGGPINTQGFFGAGTGEAAPTTVTGYGLVIQSGENEFLVVGQGVSIDFTVPGKQVEVDFAQEGTFSNGRWIPGRTINGDERHRLFPRDRLNIVRLKLLQR